MKLMAACIVVGLTLVARAGGESISFERQIQPILAERCFTCHGPDAGKRQADLRLDLAAGLQSVLQPQDANGSELLRRVISDDDDTVMPPPQSGPRLTHAEIELLRQWIDAGAKWDEHWSYAPIASSRIPAATPGHVHRNSVDAFVQSRLWNDYQLAPAPEATRAQLIRRVTLDLTGLPPDPAEVQAFLTDRAPDAYERLVDRLLASPRFGERMAWDWLDAARYADSNGYQGDGDRTMWPWRDWVVEAFNQNLSFRDFTIWQLAGDLLPHPTFQQTLATGFCRNHAINGEGGRIPEENRIDYVMDMTETMGTVWLGLTLNCCRCHDHKFDPISRREYYQLFAFFNQTPVDGAGGNAQTAPVVEVPSPALRQERTALQNAWQLKEQSLQARSAQLALDQANWESDQLSHLRQLTSLNDAQQSLKMALEVATSDRSEEQRNRITVARQDSDAEYVQVRQARDALQKQLDDLRKQIPLVMVMADKTDGARETRMLDRGLYNKPGDVVTPGVPQKLVQGLTEGPVNRLGLAQWITSPQNPLTARVIVNRYWQQLFSTGLVKTSEDFGVQGERPLQRELLDWLAAEFVGQGWDVKHLLRLIVTSHTYRQSSQMATAADYERDPENRYLSRGPRYRLPAWMVRDQALAASGLLVNQVGGPPVRGYQPAGVWEEATFGNRKYEQQHGAALYRRSVYTFWRRIVAPTMFFDNASRQVCTVNLLRTNTPLHALVTLNDVTFVEASRALAAHALDLPSARDDDRVQHVYQRILARNATASEMDILLAGLQRSRHAYRQNPDVAEKLLEVGEMRNPQSYDPVEWASWTNLCLTVLNSDEALSKE